MGSLSVVLSHCQNCGDTQNIINRWLIAQRKKKQFVRAGILCRSESVFTVTKTFSPMNELWSTWLFSQVTENKLICQLHVSVLHLGICIHSTTSALVSSYLFVCDTNVVLVCFTLIIDIHWKVILYVSFRRTLRAPNVDEHQWLSIPH